jgi:hypothetical protein
LFADSATDGDELAFGPACWSGDFEQPAISIPAQKLVTITALILRFITTLRWAGY